ncbi:TAFII28-domain-containing protein [Atractiella rhizophila]|nr:TAFII28-domain-containing protein [Atractiella rhizophila]
MQYRPPYASPLSLPSTSTNYRPQTSSGLYRQTQISRDEAEDDIVEIEDPNVAEEEEELGLGEEDDWKKTEEEKKERLGLLLSKFSPEQLDRYEHYRRSGLNKGKVQQLAKIALSQNVSPQVITVLRGSAKVFVGEVTEKARAFQASKGRSGPLTPDDIREGFKWEGDVHAVMRRMVV